MTSVFVREVTQRTVIPSSTEAFLDTLEGPTILRVRGRDGRRVRVVGGLLHGNEPSGLRAIHRVLLEAHVPEVDTLFFVGAVAAARAEPRYTHRMLPGRRDLNRCFGPPFDGSDGAIARDALEIMRSEEPEAVIDLHNNTGRNPPYGIARELNDPRIGLTALFATRFVRSRIALGSMIEAFDRRTPAVTIECGHAGSPAADAVAYAGLLRFLRLPEISVDPVGGSAMTVLLDPVRVGVREGTTLAFADHPVQGSDLVLDPEIDRHNFETVPAGTRLGWLRVGAPWPFEAIDEKGEDVSRRILEIEGGALRTRVSMIPMMMTTSARAAMVDCLFYAVHRFR